MIAILLATYNGENFLREQLDSLFFQTCTDFILYVRDDGSSDSTIKILLEYKIKFSNIVIFQDGKTNIGAARSFLWLLEKVEADYYMFCDQDDVWFSSKIQLSLDVIKSEECRSRDAGVLVHSDLIVTNKNLEIISNSLWENDKINPVKITRKYLKVVNYITGCTMFFNRKARDLAIVESNTNILMHDFWIAICVDSSNGIIISLPCPTIYYRQHGNNAVGASSKSYLFPRLQRYFHIPDFNYSIDLYNMIKYKYKINLFQYIALRINFYFKH
jgi:glycosyltransferase involved in cell wall biosynthesis